MTQLPDTHLAFLNKLRQLTARRCPDMPENARLFNYVQKVTIGASFCASLTVNGDSGIFFVLNGMVGTYHEFEGKERLSHVYDRRDIFYSNEVLPELNKQNTTWKALGGSEVLFFNLGDKNLQAAFPKWSREIQMFISLYSTYQYQGYINAMGLDRKAYSIQWLRNHPNALSVIPRSDLADMLGISKTSLKSFIKTVLYE